MKNSIFTFIFFTISNLNFGQDFNPIEPNTIKLKEQISSGKNTEVIYNYLINNAPYQVHFLFMKGANPE